MKRKTAIEGFIVMGLILVGALIVRQRLQPGQDAPLGPDPTATPRMRALLGQLDPVDQPSGPAPTPTPDFSVVEENPVLETGLLVILVREVDGSVPAETVVVRNPDSGFEQEAPDGRLVLETITGDLRFDAFTIDGVDVRATEAQVVSVEATSPAELVLTLPEPEPLVSIGLQLAPREGFFEIIGVAVNSQAARVGLQPGDAVTAIDDIPAQNWETATANAAMYGRSGDIRTLDIVVEDPPGTFSEHRLQLELLSPQN